MNSTKITISPRSIIILAVIVLLIMFIGAIKNVLLLLFASFVIASALYPLVDKMNKIMRRWIAVLLVYLVGFLITSVVFVPFFAILTEQSVLFIKTFPKYWSHAGNLLYSGELFIESLGFIPDYSGIITNLAEFGKEILNQSINITVNIFAGIITAFTLAFIVLLLLLDKQEIKSGLLKFCPAEYKEKSASIMTLISKKVGGYVRGQLLLMFLVGLLTFAGLRIIGLDFALLLGIVAGLLEIVPVIGPILAAVPAVIIALAKNPLIVLYVVAVYLIVQRIENNLLSPLILGKFLEMHPIVIVTAVFVAASTLGIFGVILSPAIAASLYVIVQELYIKKLEKESHKEEPV